MEKRFRDVVIVIVVLVLLAIILPPFLGGGFIGKARVPGWMAKPPTSVTGRPSGIAMNTRGSHNWLSWSLDGKECAWLTRDLCEELDLDTGLADKGWAIDCTISDAQRILESEDTVVVYGWWRPEYFVAIDVEPCPHND